MITELRAEIAQLKTQVDAKAEPAQPNPPVEPKPAIDDQPARAVDGTILNVWVAHPVGSIVPFPKPKKPESQKAIERQQRADARGCMARSGGIVESEDDSVPEEIRFKLHPKQTMVLQSVATEIFYGGSLGA